MVERLGDDGMLNVQRSKFEKRLGFVEFISKLQRLA